MKEIAQLLLDLEAVSLRPEEPFLWASGILSPIYCDNRLILSYPKERRLVADALAAQIQSLWPEAEMLMGTATAGIPHAALAAERLELPMGFVRGKAKDHGKQNAIEGRIRPGLKVVVVEDLISTGGSSLDVVETLRASGVEVIGLISIFTYGMTKAKERIAAAKLPVSSLTTYEELLEVAATSGYIQSDEIKKLRAFMANPQSKDWMK
ncbi:Orotate phosphoribosyltransferase [Clostridiaceae bacterium JG1575]|nr:Orotate phosphoribosyltransferase [Clostridiaceae bacterium JG1575]